MNDKHKQTTKRTEIKTVSVLFLFACAFPVYAQDLVNPGFENADDKGNPIGWTVLTDLDEATYNKPDFKYRFNEIKPVIAEPGRGGKGHALAFPKTGTWRCQVSEQDQGKVSGEIDSKSGSQRGKAAIYQVVKLKPGKYRFSAHLRTADGDCWSGAFSLGIALNGTTKYAHDDATGIQWTKHNLAMRGDPNGDYHEWGEWQKCQTDVFEIKEDSNVSVWIRFHYVNKHATNVRYEIDDATIKRDQPEKLQSIRVQRHTQDPWSYDNLADFAYILTIEPKPDHTWRHVEVRFRETEDDAFVLKLTRDGQVTLKSLAAGSIYAGRATFDPKTAFHVNIVAQGQYLRVDLPNHGGFETRIIGARGLRLTRNAEPSDAVGIVQSLHALPATLPDFPAPTHGEFTKIYDPSVGEKGPWYINDHCFVRDSQDTWHTFGITHTEPCNPTDEDFFAHATANRVNQSPWNKQPHVGHVNETAGETHVWAPHIVKKNDTYHMFYCGGGKDGHAYQINLRTSKNLTDWQWYDGNPLFTDIGNARDPMIFQPDDYGPYLMYYTRPSSIEEPFSGVAVRESKDLLHWSEPKMALVTHAKEGFGRKTESPFVFKREGVFYLSATGLSGDYRDTRVWRSLNPRRFDPDHIVARINAHAPEWIFTKPNAPPTHISHCGWKQGGLYLAPVQWTTAQWDPFGLLVVDLENDQLPARIEVRRTPEDRDPYRTIHATGPTTNYALPPGRYHITAQTAKGTKRGPLPIEIMADERTRLAPGQ